MFVQKKGTTLQKMSLTRGTVQTHAVSGTEKVAAKQSKEAYIHKRKTDENSTYARRTASGVTEAY